MNAINLPGDPTDPDPLPPDALPPDALPTDPLPLTGFTIGITAARRAEEFAALLERRGARVVQAPTIRFAEYERKVPVLLDMPQVRPGADANTGSVVTAAPVKEGVPT